MSGCLGDVEQALDLINELEEVMTLDKQLDINEGHDKFKEVGYCLNVVSVLKQLLQRLLLFYGFIWYHLIDISTSQYTMRVPVTAQLRR